MPTVKNSLTVDTPHDPTLTCCQALFNLFPVAKHWYLKCQLVLSWVVEHAECTGLSQQKGLLEEEDTASGCEGWA